MFVAGYQFQVLTPLFTIHWGLQFKNNNPIWREQQINYNRNISKQFQRTIVERYRKESNFVWERRKWSNIFKNLRKKKQFEIKKSTIKNQTQNK